MKTKVILIIISFAISISLLNAQESNTKIQKLNNIKILNEPATWHEDYFDYTRSLEKVDLPDLEQSPLPFGETIDSNLSQKLQNVLDEAIVDFEIKGLSAALSTKNGDMWTGVSGISHDTVTVKTDMLFGIGSITKNFIASIILQLYDEESLYLNDSLHHWLPNFDNIDSTVTIKQLLNHTSGIYNYTNNPLLDTIFDTITKIWTPEEILETFVLSPSFPPGTDWGYSNTNYILLGMIIREVMGNDVSYELFHRLSEPLGLNSVFLFPEEGYNGMRSHVWVPDGDSVIDITNLIDTTFFSALWTAGSIFSTPEELVKWSKGLYEGGILNDTTLALMKTTAPYSGGYYGLGTQISRIFLKKIYGHTGDVMYNSQLFYVPGDSLSIAVISNQRFAPVNNIWLDLYYAYKDVVTLVVQQSDPVIINVFPNPLTTSATIEYELMHSETVRVAIFNHMGKQIEVIEKSQPQGLQKVVWSPGNLPNGVYYIKLQAGEQQAMGKMVLMK